ncbi:MAG: acyl-CoA synthetase [Burkholderiaceae bacterium]|nr:acyl-CoA synthetase [Burkholderiaceae bacterium]
MSELLIAHRAPEARIAVRAGAPIGAGQFVADATALARQLPPARYVLNSCRDRYLFAVGFCAALIAGRTSLLPPSRTPEILAQLALRYPDTVYLADEAGGIVALSGTAAPTHWQPKQPNTNASAWPPPAIAREHVAAIAFTSGSTGEPQAQLKTWGGVVDGARAEALALQLDEAPIDDVVLIGTVSPQHMYGFESTVLMALHGPCAFAAEHPLHPDEVRAVTTQSSGRRVLITAPVHLRALVESAQSMPALDRVVSATAPLALELAQRCESMWSTRVFEVYGCTETGMVATRRTVDGPVWTTMRDVRIEVCGGEFHAYGGHVRPGPLADRLRPITDSTFELEGRAGDVVNIGGKRASLEGLNRLLLSIDGVIDGAIFEPPAVTDSTREQRLMALVVAPNITRAELLAALRAQIDAAFLPRPLLRVDSLPRNAQGKLPKAELLAVAERALGSTRRQPKTSRTVARAGDARVD